MLLEMGITILQEMRLALRARLFLASRARAKKGDKDMYSTKKTISIYMLLLLVTITSGLSSCASKPGGLEEIPMIEESWEHTRFLFSRGDVRGVIEFIGSQKIVVETQEGSLLISRPKSEEDLLQSIMNAPNANRIWRIVE